MSTKKYPADVTSTERLVLDAAEKTLADGLELRNWYRNRLKTNSWADRFEEGMALNRDTSSFGFFDKATIDGREMRVMGCWQGLAFDKPKAPPSNARENAKWIRDQMRAFILKYFMRVSDFRLPEEVIPADQPKPPAFLKPLSMWPKENISRIGFGFSQIFYKLKDGAIGRFNPEEKAAIMDLTRLSEYQWIVVKLDIFDFKFGFKLPGGAELSVPLEAGSYLVLSSDFVVNEETEDGAATYGFGYSFLRNPTRGMLNYGPGEFETAFETIDFTVGKEGDVRVDMGFATNRPEFIVDLSLDPIGWSSAIAKKMFCGIGGDIFDSIAEMSPFRQLKVHPLFSTIDLANTATGGYTERELGISQDQVFKVFLLKHFQQHCQTVTGSLDTWRQVPDWTAEKDLPDWVLSGVTS